jgi:hypothetical protein
MAVLFITDNLLFLKISFKIRQLSNSALFGIEIAWLLSEMEQAP